MADKETQSIEVDPPIVFDIQGNPHELTNITVYERCIQYDGCIDVEIRHKIGSSQLTNINDYPLSVMPRRVQQEVKKRIWLDRVRKHGR